LIKDTIRLIKGPEGHTKYLKYLKAKSDTDRNLTGKRKKLNHGEFRVKCLRERDAFISANLGDYELIYSPQIPHPTPSLSPGI